MVISNLMSVTVHIKDVIRPFNPLMLSSNTFSKNNNKIKIWWLSNIKRKLNLVTY